MIQVKHLLKTLQVHGIIHRTSQTDDLKTYKVEVGYVLSHLGVEVEEISYDRTMPEYLWVVANSSWLQLELKDLLYSNFKVSQLIEIF